MGIDMQRVESAAKDGRRTVKSFVLRASRLTPAQKKAWELYAKQYVIPFSDRKLDFEEIFGNTNQVIMEIGFGMGRTTERIATQMPSVNFIGVEVFSNGFAKLLSAAGKNRIDNLRLIRFDAVEVLETMIDDGSVAAFHIFFPDPWPKKKHRKRRLIQEPFARLLARKLVAEGYIYCVTDWEDYARQMLEVFDSVESLHNPYGGFSQPHAWRPTTGYEEKGMRESHVISEVWVEKNRG